MRIRYLGFIALVVAVVVPIVTTGILVSSRARRTALDGVRLSNTRVAERAAAQLAAFAHAQAEALRTVGGSVNPAVKPDATQTERILRNYILSFPYLRSIDVVDTQCKLVGTSRLANDPNRTCADEAVKTALAGKTYYGPIALDKDLAPLMVIGVPLEVAGKRVGAAVADVNMEGIWPVVNDIRVGETGRARLVSADGTLIGHGDPEQRGRVFMRDKDATLARIRAADPRRWARLRDARGRDVLAVWATVPDLGWTVIIEQPVGEAFAAANAMRRDLYWLVAAALVLAVGAGLLVGRGPVRSLEAMRAHAARVGRGEWDARITQPSSIKELGDLARALNEMAGELARLTEEGKQRERLGTFAQVAAGLAHDLMLPIENTRASIQLALSERDAPDVWTVLQRAHDSDLGRLVSYVQELRRLAHDGHVPLELADVDPGALARQIVEDARATPSWAGVSYAAEGEAAPIHADQRLLARALRNLVSNATDASMQRGDARIVVRVADDGDDLILSVRDNGKGMPAERLAEVLANRFRSDKRQSGVGLGLAVARQVALAHGGSLEGESRVGEGTEFRLRIPRGRQVAATPIDKMVQARVAGSRS